MLLASWASDRRDVENAPSLRQLDSGADVSLDDILEAMTALDAHEASAERETSRGFDLILPLMAGWMPNLMVGAMRSKEQ